MLCKYSEKASCSYAFDGILSTVRGPPSPMDQKRGKICPRRRTANAADGKRRRCHVQSVRNSPPTPQRTERERQRPPGANQSTRPPTPTSCQANQPSERANVRFMRLELALGIHRLGHRAGGVERGGARLAAAAARPHAAGAGLLGLWVGLCVMCVRIFCRGGGYGWVATPASAMPADPTAADRHRQPHHIRTQPTT